MTNIIDKNRRKFRPYHSQMVRSGRISGCLSYARINEIARASVIGHCSFFIHDADTGQREHHYTDAFSSEVIGDFRLQF